MPVDRSACSLALSLDQIILIAILLGTLLLFATEVLRAELVALSVMVVLMVVGFVTPEQGVSGFSNPATITVLALFIVSAGVNRSGVIDALARRVVGLIGGSETRALVAIILIVTPASAFLNNTAVVAIMLPMVSRSRNRRAPAPPSSSCRSRRSP
jgi:di/tricarboxylate transporter